MYRSHFPRNWLGQAQVIKEIRWNRNLPGAWADRVACIMLVIFTTMCRISRVRRSVLSLR